MEKESNRLEHCASEPFVPDPDLSGWFSVSGDMDDFIYYGEPEKCESER